MRNSGILLGLVMTISINDSDCQPLQHQNYRFTLDAKYGKMLNIHPFFPEVSSSFNGEFRIGWLTNGRKAWHDHYNYPEAGVSLSYSDLGNKNILGSSISLFPYLNFRPLNIGERGSIEFRPGLGLGYFTRPFDAITNPSNYVIGSKFAAAVSLYLGYTQSFGHSSVSLGFAFWHYSNGHVAVPNIGANTPYISLAWSYYTKSEISHQKDTTSVDRKWRFNLTANLGIHEVEGTILPYDGPIYPVYGGTALMSKRLNYKSRLRLGFGYSYYTAFHDYIISQEIYDDKINWRSSKMMAIIGHEFVFGRLTFLTDFGINLHYPLKKELVNRGLVTDRFLHNFLSAEIGFNYYLRDISLSSKDIPYFGIGLRSIGGKADFVNFRIGFVF